MRLIVSLLGRPLILANAAGVLVISSPGAHRICHTDLQCSPQFAEASRAICELLNIGATNVRK
jgi:hypothetical protein